MGKYYQSFAFVVAFFLTAYPMLCSSSSGCIEEERQALFELKGSFNDPSHRLSSWEGNNCCQWNGVGCSNVTGHVVMLDLRNPCYPHEGGDFLSNCSISKHHLIAQHVHPSLSQFKYLNYLDLSGNHFNSSPIPLFIDSMKHLQYLSLSDSHLNGRIPQNLGNLTNLYFLDLSFNSWLDSDDISWVSKLSLLQYLYMNDVYLGKAQNLFPTLNMFPSLLEIDLSNCSITKIHCHQHQFVSSTNLSRITSLYLAENELDAPDLDCFSNMTSIDTIDLSNNNLSSVPFWLGNCATLEYLSIRGNALNGSLTSALQNLTSLYILDLAYNHLNGSIPNFLGQENLIYLDISSNQLSGSLPCNITLFNLKYLLLNDNNLTGSLPNCWSSSQKLIEINLSSNKLSGNIPSSFGNLSSLVGLHLNNNSLHGEFPSFLRNLKQLLILDLGENQMSGTIPSWIGDIFPSIKILRLRQNKFQGCIPSQLCHLSMLQILDLSNNMLVGSIPHCTGNLTAMSQRRKPSVAEVTPGEIHYNRYLEWYDEDVSQFMKGRELHYTRNLKRLSNLDLSNNKLRGPIPEGISLLTALQGLNLSHNLLSREIPTRIGDMKSLESLDLSQNQLSGTIPQSMLSLTFLEVLNLSYNNLFGPIPQGSQFSTFIDPFIYLGNKFLCGEPLPNRCDAGAGDRDQSEGEGEGEDGEEDKSEKILFYFVVGIGFATGFWVVIGVLLLKNSWRHAYFGYIDEVMHKISVTFAIKMARLKKKCARHPVD